MTAAAPSGERRQRRPRAPAPDLSAAGVVCASYVPFTAQAGAHASEARFVCVAAGNRGGKTAWGAAEFLARVYLTLMDDARAKRVTPPSRAPLFARRPRRHYWVVAPTLYLGQQARQYLFSLLSPATLAEIARGRVSAWREQQQQLWLYPDILVEWKTAEDPRLLVSVSLDGVWLTEAPLMKSDTWPNLRARLTDRKGWAIAEGTPTGPNWFHRDFFGPGQDRRDDYESFSWRTADNPHIDPAELDHARRTMPPQVFRRLYEASFAAFEGQIYSPPAPEVFEPLRYPRVFAGVDWGYASPGACVVIGARADGIYDVINEEYASGRPLTGWIESFRSLREQHRIRTYYADPSSPMLIQSARQAGLVCVAADNDVWDGIQRVQALLHQGRLRVHTRCKNLLREMEGYHWAKDPRGGALREEPAPNQSDHACDALRYALVEETRPPGLRAL